MENALSGKTIVITGATAGIGLAAAEAVILQGGGVIGIGRSPERCQAARARLLALNPQASVAFCMADLALQSQVRGLRAQIETQLAAFDKSGLDGLVNNAGTFTTWFSQTPEGIETQWAVNHLASFLLSHQLLPLLMAAPAARIITVSSDSHAFGRLDWTDPEQRRHYNGLRAYGNTKLANILFTLEFNRQLGTGASVKAFALDPGLVKTEMGFKGTPALVRWFWSLRREGGTLPEVPARAILHLLSEPAVMQSDAIYWKDCQPKQPNRRAMNTADAVRLWALSEAMCGIAREG